MGAVLMAGRLSATIKHTAQLADRARRSQPGIVALIYHRVGGGTTSQVDLPIDVFDAQLAWLRENANVLSLDAAVEALTGVGEALPADRPAVVLTFDDGTSDFAEHALAALVRHRLPAVLYVATRFVDEQVSFPWGAPPLTWSALRDACSTGLVAIGSHTHNHVLLDRNPSDVIARELDRSRGLIAEHLGSEPVHFAYPKAIAPAAAADRLVRERFLTAALAGTRPNLVGRADLHQLARSPVQRSDGMRFFRAKVHGGLRLEDEVRRFANRFRYAEATS